MQLTFKLFTMLMNLPRELKVGEKVILTFNFEKAEKITIAAEVRDQ